MTISPPTEIRCADYPLSKKAEARPKSLIGLLWHWHIKWFPGWNVYQAYLVLQGTKIS